MAGTERLIDTLKSRGIRVTPQRAIILAAIEQMPGHVTAEEIFDSVQRVNSYINLATVYRTLDLLRETGLSDQISEEGCVSLYADEAEFKADREHIEILERFGFPHEVIGRQAIKALEPELSDRIGMAVLFPQNRSMKDPYKLVLALAERFVALGGRIERGEVVGFTRSDAMREVVLKDGRVDDGELAA